MDKKKYRVKPGAVLAHDERELMGGVDVELPPHVAYEVRHLVDPVDPVSGDIKPWSTKTESDLEADLAKAKPHERISILEAALAANVADGDKLRKLIADQKKIDEAATKALEKKAAAPAKAAEKATDK